MGFRWRRILPKKEMVAEFQGRTVTWGRPRRMHCGSGSQSKTRRCRVRAKFRPKPHNASANMLGYTTGTHGDK